MAKKTVFALAFVASQAFAIEPPQAIGLHLASVHSEVGFCNLNPGAYARWGNGVTVGAFRNSECRVSAYAGMTWSRPLFNRVEGAVTVGAVTGYARAPVMPLVVPSFQFKLDETYSLRVAFVPKVAKDGAHAIHFMLERKF